MYVTEALDFALVAEGAPIAIVGAVLSSMKVVDGPALKLRFPEASLALPDAIVMPIVPSPEQDASVTVRVAAPAPLTVAVQAAVPVVFTVMSLLANVTVDAPV